MNPLLDAPLAMKETMQAYSDLRQHCASEPFAATVRWIEALIVQNQVAMAQCRADKLTEIQLRLQQLIALRNSLAEPGGASTGYLFT